MSGEAIQTDFQKQKKAKKRNPNMSLEAQIDADGQKLRPASANHELVDGIASL